MKKTWWLLFLFLIGSVIFASAREGTAAIPLKVFAKDSYPLEDTILTGVEPNVMFFLDTSSSMGMGMTGELPTFENDDTVMQAKYPLMRNANTRAGMLADAAYGTGGRPISLTTQTVTDSFNARRLNGGIPNTGTEQEGFAVVSTYPSRRNGWTRWGKDLNTTNNKIGDPYSYYSPDPAKPYLLTFKDRNWANWNGAGTPPSAYGNGLGEADSKFGLTATGALNTGSTKADIAMPTALRAYLPGGARYGDSVADATLVQYLVPNDSKMYQMKLVLWRLIDSGYAQILSGMRIGMAGNYFDYITAAGTGASAARGPMYRRGPHFGSYGTSTSEGESGGTYLGGNTHNFRATHNGAANQTIAFPHGTGAEAYSGIIGGDYGMAEAVFAMVSTTYGTGDAATRRHGSRAYMRVPFDYLYTYDKNTGLYNSTDSLIAFRELIDGVEQYNTSAATASKMVNEELVAGGTAQLAAVFYSRGTDFHLNGRHASAHSGSNLGVLGGRYAIDYTTGLLNARALWTSLSTSYGSLAKRFRNSEGLMTGTALGSVYDFFSPFGGTNGLTFTQYAAGNAGVENLDVRGYFPVTGSCQANWLVVFTGGNEQSLAELVPAGQDASLIALRNLYLNSRTMRGRHWDGEKWIHREYAMDVPIRTIFVGLLPPEPVGTPDGPPNDPDLATDPPAKRLRKRITRMARAGQPHSDGTPDTTIRPYFADNVSDLIQALQSILLSIRTERFASGAPVVLPLYEDAEDGEKALFAASYHINMMKQWEGTFHKYIVSTDLNATTNLDWEAETLMASNGVNGVNRNVY
ncbi:MAG: hypothetical protein LBT15_00055, partial [Synergistaceae bacterium]|nr:hypothetical protein [Synergistaceae bacterium]